VGRKAGHDGGRFDRREEGLFTQPGYSELSVAGKLVQLFRLAVARRTVFN